ncbi:hypothetical protein FIBSPDRAFT_100565 [Athelia psychrophila]|uniref:Uncharacterized protein n=1 Tax=Athelia psychrophila TaxID=1759441 RepID=A0A166DJE3_9AGAM|nr:hypothetical protein FIBSPDRAFT_100565 [Fibularhizoctonia sp. CBS 109695]
MKPFESSAALAKWGSTPRHSPTRSASITSIRAEKDPFGKNVFRRIIVDERLFDIATTTPVLHLWAG